MVRPQMDLLQRDVAKIMTIDRTQHHPFEVNSIVIAFLSSVTYQGCWLSEGTIQAKRCESVAGPGRQLG